MGHLLAPQSIQRRTVQLLSLVILLGMLLGLTPAAIALTGSSSPQLGQSLPTPSPNGGSFVTVAVNRVGPSVVRIDTERVVTRNLDPFFNDPFFERFFGGDMFPNPGPRQQLQRGQGSGFIVDSSGTILTNAHVVNRADRVTVRLKDGRDFEGRVTGVDTVTDLAVIKVDTNGSELPVAPLGDSERVQVGDWAIAVGNPLGLDNTVTLGIVSTLNRSSAQVGIPDKRLDFIQTDAAINPGNSGGPLLNDRGEVIGVNTAIRADANGIGFAIPINTVKAVSDRLARGESIAHPFIGIQMIGLTPEIARENNRDPNGGFNLPEREGVLVMRVLAASPAEEAGLRRGDVITQIDGEPVSDAESLQRMVENSRVGQVLRLQVIRGDRTLSLRVRTGELQANAR
ncbi:MAG: PDZ domain-containing protein [Phormidium sp. GEM2.Bin31]|nr:trypsin-like peptidase domain-containing protein [Phormidium sp. BM_Day4_Bin.17]TVR12926.1 MAG: PDZ domain-containing protein [Phormidium sp. GEM2.Bin31]UCJ12620.1 MAG: trypsin-like peptidase domain-containing protein [Phormidium sp. PBR-2020]